MFFIVFLGFLTIRAFVSNWRDEVPFGFVGVALDHAQTLLFSLSIIVEIGRFIILVGLSVVRGGA